MSSGNCSTFSRFSSATLNANMLHSVYLLIVDSIIESYILVGNLIKVHNKLTNLRYACFSLFVFVVPILGTGSLSCSSVTVFPRFIALVTAFPRLALIIVFPRLALITVFPRLAAFRRLLLVNVFFSALILLQGLPSSCYCFFAIQEF